MGGPTTNQCIPLLERLRAENKGVLFAYSVEVDEDAASGHACGTKSGEQIHKRIVKEMIHSIDVAANFEDTYASSLSSPSGRRTWIAIKLVSVSFPPYPRQSLNPSFRLPLCPTTRHLSTSQSTSLTLPRRLRITPL